MTAIFSDLSFKGNTNGDGSFTRGALEFEFWTVESDCAEVDGVRAAIVRTKTNKPLCIRFITFSSYDRDLQSGKSIGHIIDDHVIFSVHQQKIGPDKPIAKLLRKLRQRQQGRRRHL